MTGPLAQQIASLWAYVAPEPRDSHVRAALSVIERHVQDMETALRDVARVSDDALQDGHPGIPDVARLHRIAVAVLDDLLAAALPAREKGEE